MQDIEPLGELLQLKGGRVKARNVDRHDPVNQGSVGLTPYCGHFFQILHCEDLRDGVGGVALLLTIRLDQRPRDIVHGRGAVEHSLHCQSQRGLTFGRRRGVRLFRIEATYCGAHEQFLSRVDIADRVTSPPGSRPGGLGVNLQASRGCFSSGGPLTVLVCSSCHALLREGSSHCPRCGPGSLALFGSELSALDPRPTSDTRELDRLALALGRQFRVVRMIGRGGFAEVYEVVDTDLQRRLAVKVLRSDLPWGAGHASPASSRRPAPSPGSTIPTPCRSTSWARAKGWSTTPCPTWRAAPSPSCCGPKARSRRTAPCGSSSPSSTRCSTPTTTAWSTATSSPTTSCSRPGPGGRCWWTSAS